MTRTSPSKNSPKTHHLGPCAEQEKVPSSASVLVRKDFGIRENLTKAPGGKKIKKGKKHKEIKKNVKKSFEEELYCEASCSVRYLEGSSLYLMTSFNPVSFDHVVKCSEEE